jgi:hypothetical protein
MLLYENKKAKLLYFLKMGLNPFKKFVSTGEIEEELGLVDSRKDLFNQIKNIIQNEENFILPIIGEIGTGKTHLFWALKRELIKKHFIYLSLDTVYKRFFYNSYSELIEEMGLENIRKITRKLCNKWGALEKKFGFFPIVDINKVRRKAYKDLSESIKDVETLTDIVNVITTHQLDPYKRIEAENYILGELMDIKELSHLNLKKDLRSKKNAFEMLKILIENSEYGSVIYIDDFTKISSLMKPEEEREVVFDPSWLYGAEKTPDNIAAKKIINKIFKLQEIKNLTIIITLNSLDALEELKKIISSKDSPLLTILKEPMIMPKFEEKDIYEFYKKNMKIFLKRIGLKHEEHQKGIEVYFPLNREILKYIYECSGGNPRKIIKRLIKIFNYIIYRYEDFDYIIENYNEIC